MERKKESDDLFPSVPGLHVETMAEAQKHVDNLTKPLGALGRLEETFVRLAGITGETVPSLDRKVVVVFCGDHGVTEEGVSAYPSEVTGLMIRNFCDGKAAVNVFARCYGAKVRVVDVGSQLTELPAGVLNRKVRAGTANMVKGPAMSGAEAIQAIRVGLEMAQEMKEQGFQLAAVGEMGIGNTTAAAAVSASLTGRPVEELVGRGTGIDDVALKKKGEAIRRSLEVNQPDPSDPLDVLAKVGGLELAAMTGFILGACAQRLSTVIDGVISTASALAAFRLVPGVRDYLFASHLSEEPAHQVLLKQLELDPLIDASMRLGEGSGAVLSFPLFDGAVAAAREMATFADLGM
ncbi:nicotinate-nucleotide-dimethylbenzimidazole phosphoribosyltransferase [Melghirimyces algeriensis]|uniref:Nicotinate-nucleotide--dimethylbenzimidazole phosphoribosyltransferase n=1 Tax=Melghirimyces algeriensis TaxID=910412 RepID=A0A521DPX7_9BACL|nr:nicotinate-nucleotide--dimethylbenzimidazole phosphoribosyltransferase [Melghirimyces algeriensis]SMO73769.1 nicotinate-nucleotide-dimethylbenzimidazole phosphoribosyltransferase [Melghirimyces algeriensis]